MTLEQYPEGIFKVGQRVSAELFQLIQDKLTFALGTVANAWDFCRSWLGPASGGGS